MTEEEIRSLISKKVARMRRPHVEEGIFKALEENREASEEFINNHLDSYVIDSPAILAAEINAILSVDTSLGLLFKDLLKITDDKIGMGEALLSLCIKDAVSGGTEDTDIILENQESYEVKKISKGGIFSFSERFTEYNDLGLIMNMAILNFGKHDLFSGKNLYTVSTKEVRTFKLLLEKFLLPNDQEIVPFYLDQFVVKINGMTSKIEEDRIIRLEEYDSMMEAYCSMFNFRDQVLSSKIKSESMHLFTRGCGAENCTRNIINDLFSITALKQILKNTKGIFLVLPDLSLSYFTPHDEHGSLYDPREIFLYDISRNKMNFKGPFLKGSRAEKTPGELPEEFKLL
jgi:hypothetical protein